MTAPFLPLAAGLDQVIERYDHYGPLLAAFLANLLATFGDKGQLAVITLATRYDAKRVFVGAMAAFAGWSAVEVALGNYLTRVLPEALLGSVTGSLFVLFGVWTAYQVVDEVRDRDRLVADGSSAVEPASLLPDGAASALSGHGPVATSFLFVALAEVGDKTQLLTINLAATFSDSLLAVYVGVVAALGLRTGVDAFLGEQAERWLPTLFIEAASAAVFVAFGLFELGLIGGRLLLVVVVAALLSCVGAAARRQVA